MKKILNATALAFVTIYVSCRMHEHADAIVANYWFIYIRTQV